MILLRIELILCALIVGVNLYLANAASVGRDQLPTPFGYGAAVVLSGSMEPTYSVGSLIYVKSTDYKQLKVGDPITFLVSEDTVATHRIIEVLPDEDDPNTIRYFTQGDANDAPDGSSVHYKNIIGKPVFSIPYLGYVSNYIQPPPGKYVAISGCALLMLLVFLPDIFVKDEKKDSAV